VEDEAIIVDGDGGGGVEAAGRGEEGGVAGAIRDFHHCYHHSFATHAYLDLTY